MSIPLMTLALEHEAHLVDVRQRTRQLAELLGFDTQDQTRLATAVSEVARNALQYGRGGTVAFSLAGRTAPQIFTVVIKDQGPGIPDLRSVLDGTYRSTTGLGLGIAGARRLVDQFAIESSAESGTRVSLTKVLPRGARVLAAPDLPRLLDRLLAAAPLSPLTEVQRQNQELLRALATLRDRQEELVRLNGELQDTNRGVVALFAELDEKAEHLRRADEMKTRFLSNMSHEFRTPLNAIRGLTNLLLERLDGDLNAEQEKQVRLIARAASELSELVDDLLDLAKVEAGKVDVRPIEIEVPHLFGALRGMLRPLWLNTAVALVFEECESLPRLFADEGKVSQVLRNLLSNALKFTEKGEVRVSAALAPDPERVRFTVKDTGIGIAPADQERIFQEFTQVDSTLQRRSRGTGLGLPLSRKLAELLGGTLTVTSELGAGSAFTLEIPLRHEPVPAAEPQLAPVSPQTNVLPVLVVEDSPEMVLLYEKILSGSPFTVVHAATLARARQVLARRQVAAIILDIVLRGEDAWTFLAETKSDPSLRSVPVLVVTQVDDAQKASALGADAFAKKPPERRWILDTLNRLVTAFQARRVLLVDDEEASRYLLRRLLEDIGWSVVEAESSERALELAAIERPTVVILDGELLRKPGGDRDLAAELARSGRGRMPVMLVTSQDGNSDIADRIGAAGLLPMTLPRHELRARLVDLLKDVAERRPDTEAESQAGSPR